MAWDIACAANNNVQTRFACVKVNSGLCGCGPCRHLVLCGIDAAVSAGGIRQFYRSAVPQ